MSIESKTINLVSIYTQKRNLFLYFIKLHTIQFIYPFVWVFSVWGKMKLFQQMLVAGAALSLIAPIAAQASDINLEEMNNYSCLQCLCQKLVLLLEQISSKLHLQPTFVGRVSFYLTRKMPIEMGNSTVSKVTKKLRAKSFKFM